MCRASHELQIGALIFVRKSLIAAHVPKPPSPNANRPAQGVSPSKSSETTSST